MNAVPVLHHRKWRNPLPRFVSVMIGDVIRRRLRTLDANGSERDELDW